MIRQFHTLGQNTLQIGEKTVILERKTAAILAYLALEGPTSRSRLAGLLWPDSEEATARNNLSQTLRRLKRLAGGELFYTEDALRLSDGLMVDAVQLKAAALEGRAEVAAGFPGELLAAHDYDDLPEFSEWLRSAREELHALRRDALEALITNLEAQENFRAALGYAERLVKAEPVSEVAHRHVMHFHYLLGDRAAAFKAYARLKETLEREVGAEPLPETVELARRIEQEAVPSRASPAKKALPPQVLRPPVLVGREQEWAVMEAAWAAGQGIILEGAPGVGKTRLAQEFAASKGPYLLFAGRPGDNGVPYATHTRNYRQTLTAHSDVVLEPWVRRELARMLPELGESPSPMTSEAEKLRFYEAKAQLLRRVAAKGPLIIVSDDLQYNDLASVEAGNYVLSNFWGEAGSRLRAIICYRKGELHPSLEPLARNLISAGLAVHIDLQPLSPDAVEALLDTLCLPEVAGLGAALGSYTGGNPLFVLETLKQLLETGRLAAGLPERLSPPGKVGPLVQRRLERLSPLALRVAQTAATLNDDFSPTLVGEILGLSGLELLRPWDELDQAQLFNGNRFAHDLVYEAVRSGTPPTIAALLHRRAADALAARGAQPARVVRHLLEGGDEVAAVPFILQAAALAEAEYRPRDADALYERAAEILCKLGRHDELQRVLEAKATLSVGV